MVVERPYFTKSRICFYETYTKATLPPLGLLMGYSGSAAAWPPSFLKKLAAYFRVITVDNRGTGQSAKPTALRDYSIGHFAEDWEEGLRFLAPEGAHVLGYSLGGCIAQEHIHQYPSRVKALCLLSTTAGGALRVEAQASLLSVPPITSGAGEGLWGMYLATWRHALSDAALQEHETALRELFQRSRIRLASFTALRGQSEAFLKFDGTSYLKDIQAPVLVVTGDSDRVVPRGNARNLHQALLGSQYHEFQNCGHAPYLEREQELVERLAYFR